MSEKVQYDILVGKNTLGGALKDLDRDADKAEAKISSLGKGGANGGMLGSIVGGNLIASGISKATSAIVDFGVQSFQSFGKFEQFGVALTTMFHGNKVEAEQLSNELVDFAKKTPFQLEEVQAATRQLIAYGSTSGSVGKELKMLGDISSGVGAPIGEIAYLYGTARTQGRLFARDIYQLSGRGIPIVEALAKQFKVTKDKVMDLVSAGKVGFNEMQKAMESMTAKGGQFSGMMDAQSKTVLGQYSNLQDAWSQLQVHIGESQKGIIESTMQMASKFVGALDQMTVTSNHLDANLKRGGIKESFFKVLNPFANDNHFSDTQILADTYEKRNQRFQGEHNNKAMYEDMTSLLAKYNEKKALREQGLKSGMANIPGQGKSKNDELWGDMVILSNAMQHIMQYNNLKKNQKMPDNSSSSKGDKTLGTGTTIETAAPKIMNININKLIETQEIHSVNMEQSYPMIKDATNKALLEVLNDAHLAQQ